MTDRRGPLAGRTCLHGEAYRRSRFCMTEPPHVSNIRSPAEENASYKVIFTLIFTRSVFGAGFLITSFGKYENL